jgi:nuclear GTP-binding protein
MAKGKNHDRKANPDFGKTKSKKSSSGTTSKPEFNMKRVKGGCTWLCGCLEAGSNAV